MDRRDVPERREMDLIGNIFKKHWGKITIIIFTLGGAWALLQAQVSEHTDAIKSMRADTTDYRDFKSHQQEINKRLEDKVDDVKIDTKAILRELRRR